MPVNLERLRATNLDIRLRGKRILAPNLPIDNLDARFLLENGRLSVEPLKFGVASGTIGGSIVLDGRKDVPRVETNLALQRLSLKRFFEGSQLADVTAGRFGGRVQLAGSGKSLAEILATSDGRLALSMADGRLSALITEAAGIDLAEALPRLFGDDESYGIRCIVGDFRARDGIFRSQILVIDTTDTNITGEATVNMQREALDVRLVAHPKDPSPLSARTPVTISGSFANPAVGVDPSGLVARGAAAIALGALLTPLAALIPLIELGLGEDSDCNGLIQQAQKAKKG
jgi:uncharacterized protein involved in outer membrane biogenesis